MKKIIVITVLLLSSFDIIVNAQKSTFSQDYLVENYYLKAQKINESEKRVFKNFTDSIRKNPPSCDYISANKSFFNYHDFVFEQLLLFQKVGKKNNDQNVDILRWVKERTSNYVAFNNLSETYKCISTDDRINETRNQILVTLKELGSLKDFMESVKKSKSLSATSSPNQICEVFSELNKESDKIEPYLEILAIYYNSESSPTISTIKNKSKVIFVNPKIKELAEKLLEFRTNYFLRQKEYIKANVANYGCN